MRAVAAVPATGLLVGSAVGLLVPTPPPPFGITLLITSAPVALCAWRAGRTRTLATAVWVGFFVGGSMLSANAWNRASQPPVSTTFRRLAQYERAAASLEGRRLPEDDEAFAFACGVLRSDATRTLTGVTLNLEVDSVRGAIEGLASTSGLGGLQVTVVGSLAAEHLDEWRAGRRVCMPAQLRRPSRYLDPGVPDYERAMARRGTVLVGTVKSGALVELRGRGGRLDEATGAVRAFAGRAIRQAVGSWSDESARIVAAIVIGDRTGLDDELQRRLQDAGTYHVIAISGGNIAIVAGLILAAFRFAGVSGRLATATTAITALIVYARLVGGGASVNRATLMAVVFFAARGLDQRSHSANALALVAGCLVLWQPLSVFDPALILTLGATLAILSVVPLLYRQNVPRVVRPAASLLAASIATEIALLPVGAELFSRVTFAGLALNFAAIPLMSVAEIAGMAVVPLSLLSARAASWTGFVAHLGAAGLVRTADLVTLMPALSLRVAPPSWLVVVLYYAAIATAYFGGRPWRRAAIAAALVVGLWIVAEPWAFISAFGDGRLHVTFVDVGQGDSIFVRFPSSTSLLVDAGGLSPTSTFDIGDRIVAPVLRAAGVRRLDVLALTHGDPDHIGGAKSVMREFRPKTVWEGIPVPPFEALRQLRGEAAAVGAHWSNLTSGQTMQIDGVEVAVLHPGAPDWERQRVRNDDSIVLELRWREVSVVLTGDIGRTVEGMLAPTLRPAPIRIVKVAHHGSLTSSAPEFVRALAPRVAVVSAGRSNHFGHPVPEVLQRYRDAGAEIFRTDQDGAVTIDTDGHSVDVHTFVGRRLGLTATPVHHEDTMTTKTTKP